MWNMDVALAAVRKIERALAGTWHVALAGSVLHKGKSDHDIDVVAFPRSKPDADIQRLRMALKSLGWKCTFTADDVLAGWRVRGSRDTKHVEVWRDALGRRMDVFVLS